MTNLAMLELENTTLVLIDLQVNLLRAIQGREELVSNARKLVQGSGALEVPVIFTEQYPDGLGATDPTVAELLSGDPITKLSFSCCAEPKFMDALNETGRKQVLLAGIESHVCVYQTAVDLIAAGFDVQVVADVVASRTPMNRQIGLNRMAEAGASLTSIEMVLFELLGIAKGEKFKKILKIVK